MTPFLLDSLHQAMSLSKYRFFMGVVYKEPHSCFRLVDDIFTKVYKIDLAKNSQEHLSVSDRLAAIQQSLSASTNRVSSEPLEGDLAIMRTLPWHIGVVIGEGKLIHVYGSGVSCVEDYDSPILVNRIEGFYRYKGLAK